MSHLLNDTTLSCPKCGAEIRLTESLVAPFIAEEKKRSDEKLAKVEKELRAKQNEVDKKMADFDAELQRRLKIERGQVAKEEAKKARLEFSNQIRAREEEVEELNRIVAERDKSLEQSVKERAALKRRERELDEQKREIELTVESRVNESIQQIRSKAQDDAEDKLRLKMTEKDQTIASMRNQIEILQRKAEQGSQQFQGEVQEIELESLLRSRFPADIIRPVPKGVAGGDVLQEVLGPNGKTCGAIIWECKRTRNWSDGWLQKLRNNQRSANADAAILVSEALPKGLETFDLKDGVWVAEFRCAVAVATAIRHVLLEVSSARKAEEGQQTKMEMVYRYLTGPKFRSRVSAIVEQFTIMHADLMREKRTTTKLWAKREEQIQSVLAATAGMYGDLQGIGGGTFEEIVGLDYAFDDSVGSDLRLEA